MTESHILLWVDNNITETRIITSDSIPMISDTTKYTVYYKRAVVKGRKVQVDKVDRSESFHITAFKINASELDRNSTMFVSKGEVVKTISLGLLAEHDHVDNCRYLFFIEGDYIDNNIDETRGNIQILSLSELKKLAKESPLLYQDDVNNQGIILLDDITYFAKEKISEMFSEINDRVHEQDDYIQNLQQRFLLPKETIKKVRHEIRVTDTCNDILKKVYRSCAVDTAQTDAVIEREIENLSKIEPTSQEYLVQLQKSAKAISRTVPLQNKNSLTQYVARRKIVLELFDKILAQKLPSQNDKSRKHDEQLLHDLLFQQSSSNSDESDLWILNEDFIYFDGTSNIKIEDVQIYGKRLIKTNFTQEETEHLTSLKERRLDKRPDVLLFPNEGKCVIIEFKAPNVNVAQYITQILDYATLIYNYSSEEFHFTGFYGYLIGESINSYDVKSVNSNFENAYNFDYLFCTQNIADFYQRKEKATLYMEVIKYSTLLQRALKRNEKFISKIIGPDDKNIQ